jgi:hypothetical protein
MLGTMTRHSDPTHELGDKLSRLHKTMAAGGFGAAHLSKLGNLAWLLCGGDALVSFTDPPVAEAVVTPQRVVVLMAEIERDRLEREAFPPGVEARYYAWYDPEAKRQALDELVGGRKVLADATGIEGADVRDFWTLRTPLTREEVTRYRELGHDAAEAFTDALTGVQPGMREHEVAGRVAKELRARGMQSALILVAADERLKRYRHPLPTDNRFEERLMVVACARRHGLYANLTRLVSRRPLGEDAAAYRGLLEVEGVLLRYTQHGVNARELFRELREAYAAIGFPDEWRRHHQGGACGYETRDLILKPDDTMLVDGSAYAWNPSLPGLKVEDTVLLLDDRLEVLTHDPRWPSVELGGRARPDVLVLEP